MPPENNSHPLSNNNNSSQLPSDADLAALAALISADHSDEHADENLAELLQQLETADGVARGMEGRRDSLLERLDGLVEVLEANQDEKEKVGTQDASLAPQDEDPIPQQSPE